MVICDMQLLENPTFLRSIPHLIKLFLGGLLTLVGLVGTPLVGGFLKIDCTRPLPDVVACHSVVSFLGLLDYGWRHTSTGVLDARIVEDCGGDSCNYTVVLVNREAGNYRLNSFYFDKDGAQETLAQLKAFLADPAAPPFSRTCYDPKSLLILIFFPVLMLIGGISTLVRLLRDLKAEKQSAAPT